MAIYAIIPVKKLANSKKRLSTVFTPQEREMLTSAMLSDVLNALKDSIVDKVVVVGEDPQVQQLAETFSAVYLCANRVNLNSAIEKATSFCVQKGAGAVLVLPADIPLVKAKEIDRIIKLAKGVYPVVVLSPSKDCGTNALYQSPPKLIPACFGPKSFLAHIRSAYGRGVSARLYSSTGLAADIDSAEDLNIIFNIPNKTECRKVLERIAQDNQKQRNF